MEKVKNVSEPVEYKDLNRKYVNIHSKNKNEKQKRNNESIKNILITEIYKYTKFEPMFSELQIFNFEKYEIHENDEYVYDCNLIIYLDSNKNVIKENFNILNKYPKINYSKKDQIIKYDTEKCEINEDGSLINIKTKKEGLGEIFKKYKMGGAITIISIIAMIFSGIFFPFTIPVCITGFFGGVILIKKSANEQEKNEQEKINEIIESENISEKIKKFKKKNFDI